MLHYIVPPLIGAVIGYFTNYIAVKMLFRPRKEIRVFGRVLPFTPGAIPKNKPRLAKAVGDVVENTFFDENTIAERFLTEESVNRAVNQIVCALDRPICDLGTDVLGSQKRYYHAVHRTSEVAANTLLQELQRSEVIEEVSNSCIDRIVEQLRSSMFGMFLTDKLIESAKELVQTEIRHELDEKGEEFLTQEFESKLQLWGKDSPSQLAFEMGCPDARMQDAVRRVYTMVIRKGVPLLVKKIHISQMIEEQINAMSTDELEDLVLSVMKHELSLIVNLGAIIGLVLGMLNLIF